MSSRNTTSVLFIVQVAKNTEIQYISVNKTKIFVLTEMAKSIQLKLKIEE